jgi:hypothetical protein
MLQTGQGIANKEALPSIGIVSLSAEYPNDRIRLTIGGRNYRRSGTVQSRTKPISCGGGLSPSLNSTSNGKNSIVICAVARNVLQSTLAPQRMEHWPSRLVELCAVASRKNPRRNNSACKLSPSLSH